MELQIPQGPKDSARKIGLHTTPKGDQVFLRKDGSFSVKLKSGEIIHYNDKEEVLSVDEKESTPWPPIMPSTTEPTPETNEPKIEAELPEKTTNKSEGGGEGIKPTLEGGIKTFYTSEETLDRREYPDGSVEGFDWDGSSLGRYKIDESGKRIDVPFDAPISAPKIETEPEPAPKLEGPFTSEQMNKMHEEAEKARILAQLRETIARNEKIIEDAVKELREIEKRIAEAKKKETIKTPEVDTFSTDFIKERVLLLLKAHVDVKSFDIIGPGKEITLTTTIKKFGGTITIVATLVSKNGKIILKNPPIVGAVWPYKNKAEKEIAPHLDKISETIKEFLETEKKEKTGKDVKVDTMEIVNGELKVTYK